MKKLELQRQWRPEAVIVILMALSFLVRLVYCIHMPYNCSSHDLGAQVEAGSAWYRDGHLGYLQYIYQNGTLPSADPRTLWSYYNPPFYYVTAALFLKINSIFGLSMAQMMENLQLLTTLFATFTIHAGYKIVKEFEIKGKALVLSVAVLAFHPYFIIGGVTLNNDMLSILFIFLTILYTIRWYKHGKTKDIVILALCIGLGMMTKLSVGLIAVAVAMMFLVRFIKEKQYIACIRQFILFGIICVPLGMYWSIRNAIRYGMPLVYVQALAKDSPQFVGYNIAKRLGLFDFNHLADPFVRINASTDYNIWTNLFKTAMFDERTFGLSNTAVVVVSRILLYTSIVIGVLALFMGISNDIKTRWKDPWINRFKYVCYLLFMGSYIKFCFQFPVICSMNFRYVVPVLVVSAVNIGQYEQRETGSRCVKWIMKVGIIIFIISSIVLYMMI